MEIELSRVEYQEDRKRIVATVSYGEEQPTGEWNRSEASMFLDWIDSYEEIKRQAFEKAKAFLVHCASSH